MSTILIVDNREIDRQVIASILKAGGHTVLEGTSGAQALEPGAPASKVAQHVEAALRAASRSR